MNPKSLTLVVAMDEARAIGRDGGLPWRLPGDLKHFKRTTMGHAVVMGRRTFEEVGKPLPGRQNIIVSTRLRRAPAGCVLARDIGEAVDLAHGIEVMIIGGGQIYAQTLGRASRLVVTHVAARVAGADTWFPRIDGRRWLGQLLAVQPPDARHDYGFEIRDYLRRWQDDRRLCRVPRPGGRPVRLERPLFERLAAALRDRVPQRAPGHRWLDLVREIPASPGERWPLLRVKLELEAAGELLRLPGRGPQRLVKIR